MIAGDASGGGTWFNDGFFFAAGSGASVENGDMTITGSGFGNIGINGWNAVIDTTEGSGSVTLDGAGSANGTHGNSGIRLAGGGIATCGSGGIDLDGTGAGSGSGNVGVSLSGNDVIAMGNDTITIDGTGGNGTEENDGVHISSNVEVMSDDGDITIRGTGRGTADFNAGILISKSEVKSIGTGSLTLDGNGSAAATQFGSWGVLMTDSDLHTGAGDLFIFGTGGTGVDANFGVTGNGSEVAAGGTLRIEGTSNNATTGIGNAGVSLVDSVIDGGAGTAIAGTGGGGTGPNHGVWMDSVTTSTIVASNVTGTAGAGDTSEDLAGNFF